MNHHGKQINHILILKKAKTKAQQIQRVAGQLEIPELQNKTTGNLENHMKLPPGNGQ